MRKRKHPPVVNKKRKSRYQPLRRRTLFMNFALATAALMGISLAMAGFGRSSTARTDLRAPGEASATTTAPASAPSTESEAHQGTDSSGS